MNSSWFKYYENVEFFKFEVKIVFENEIKNQEGKMAYGQYQYNQAAQGVDQGFLWSVFQKWVCRLS